MLGVSICSVLVAYLPGKHGVLEAAGLVDGSKIILESSVKLESFSTDITQGR